MHVTTVRMARATDAHALAEMNRAFNKVDVEPEAVAANLRDATELVAVAMRRGEHVGFVCAQVHDSFCYQAPYAEITELFVKGGHRRAGSGTKLLHFMEARLARRGVVHLHILTGVRNRPARTLYDKLGYRRAKPEVLYEKDIVSRAATTRRVGSMRPSKSARR
jgi:ribosomal protein S18 acetylase RimI-like enzyme